MHFLFYQKRVPLLQIVSMNGVVTIELSPKYILISPLGYCLYCVFYATALSLLKESNTFAEKYYTFNENVVK